MAAAPAIAIVDAGSGNLVSCTKAFTRMADRAPGRPTVAVTTDPEMVARADRLVMPGQGAFADVRAGLAAIDGMIEAVQAFVAAGRPFFGICVGMQLMAETGEEYGTHPGFGWIPGRVTAMTEAAATGLKIPHMGWNDLAPTATGRVHPVLAGLAADAHAYFVHSYAMRCAEPADVLATVDYGGAVTAIVGRDAMIGTQFHPEKSQATGMRMIANFLAWTP